MHTAAATHEAQHIHHPQHPRIQHRNTPNNRTKPSQKREYKCIWVLTALSKPRLFHPLIQPQKGEGGNPKDQPAQGTSTLHKNRRLTTPLHHKPMASYAVNLTNTQGNQEIHSPSLDKPTAQRTCITPTPKDYHTHQNWT